MTSGTFNGPFDSPAAFVRAVEEALRPPSTPPILADENFVAISRTRAASVSIPENLFTDPFAGHRATLASLWSALVSAAPKYTAHDLGARVGLGLLEYNTAEAFITKSGDSHFAIMISSGMMTLLHKCSKFTVAAIDPASVIFCNRVDPRSLTRQDLIDYKLELIAEQREHDAPRGAMIQLKDASTIFAAKQLCLAELFIVAHELGHYYNGDLEEDSRFSAIGHHGGTGRFRENEEHVLEHRADVTGFRLAAAALPAFLAGATKSDLLFATIVLFNDLYLLAGGPTSSHPDPLDRSVYLMREVEGARSAKLLEDSYTDPGKLLRLVKKVRKRPKWPAR